MKLLGKVATHVMSRDNVIESTCMVLLIDRMAEELIEENGRSLSTVKVATFY